MFCSVVLQDIVFHNGYEQLQNCTRDNVDGMSNYHEFTRRPGVVYTSRTGPSTDKATDRPTHCVPEISNENIYVSQHFQPIAAPRTVWAVTGPVHCEGPVPGAKKTKEKNQQKNQPPREVR